MPDAVDPVPEHLHTVTPRLVLDDAAAAIEFYRAAFGAEKLGEPFADPDGNELTVQQNGITCEQLGVKSA